MTPQILYKSLPADMKPHSFQYEIGKWYKHKGKLEICHCGFHASKNIIDAMGYVNAEVLAQVEVRGQSQKQDDKQVWSEMRIVKAWRWEKEDSVALAIYAAELVIDIYEKKYPEDKRPREAIKAAKRYLKNPSEAAAWAAGAAAWAAEAARAAARVAGAAAEAETRTKCHNFVLQRLENKKPI